MGKVGDQDDVNEYERIRNERIAQNKTRLQQSGVLNISKSLLELGKSTKRKKMSEKQNAMIDTIGDKDYHPPINGETDEEYDPLNFEVVRKVITRSGGRAQVQYIPPRSLKRHSTLANKGLGLNDQDYSMKLRQRSQNQKHINEEQTIGNQDGQDISQHTNCDKNMTMADFILHKKQQQKGKDVVNNHVNPSQHFGPGTQNGSTQNESSSRRRLNFQGVPQSLGEDLFATSPIEASLNHQVHFNEPEIDKYREGIIDSEDEGLSDSMNEFCNELGKQGQELQQGASEDESEEVDLDSRDFELDDVVVGEKTRGPTMLHDVHMRAYEEREKIYLNELGQPIGPITAEKDSVSAFSRFLGTIARDYGYAPLVFNTWKKVPNKDKMWEYVLMKYIVPEDGKDWVLRTIGAAWRLHKCRFKKKHYYSYNDDKTRWQNRSRRVPDEDFINLLATWKKKSEKIRCSRNRAHRLSQRNMHTVGPRSFATIRERMRNEHPNKEPPSLAALFERTRRRNEGKTYKETYEDTAKKIKDMQNCMALNDGSAPSDAFLSVMGKEYDGRRRLYGRGVCNRKLKKKDSLPTPYVVPGEVMESLKTGIYEEIRKDLDCEFTRLEDKCKTMEEEHLKKKEELQNIQLDLDHQRENMTEEILQKLLKKLPPEVITQYLS